ncbi:CRISPR-associated endoribonuclease Cas6 [Sulfobacillus thermotolerans]|uniref:CRISPR-associated endoribonuclease n=1 Tax=Sulfobacillus thermotolerans TaxID=338644 RepID=A0ABN5H0T0_9FIRM|nr:CRISPR-associated endoribonuclease Cas6 [Sulfobacillus thermotolerans]
MRVLMELTSKKAELIVPFHYTEWLQAAIYSAMGQPVAQAVHDVGFPVDNRALKLFTFSRLLGKYRVGRETLSFSSPVKLVVASPLKIMIQEFVNAIVFRNEFRLGPEVLTLSQITVDNSQVDKPYVRVKTLSPISTHSTLSKGDGSKYTVYYHPREQEFSQFLHQNLVRKYLAIHGQPWRASDVRVHITGKTESKMNIVYYKDTIIKGYSGVFDISGPVELLQTGMDAGFGDRSSLGFGLVELMGRR